jgi:hypothetical protein
VSDQVSHPYKTTDKIIVLYILNFIFSILNLNFKFYIFYSKMKDKIFCTEWQKVFPDFNLLLISSWKELWFIIVVPKHLKCFTLSKDLLSIIILSHCPALIINHYIVTLSCTLISRHDQALSCVP